ncbi:MAG: rhodanese-like domain-containing protein [Xenococcaceae cyanobacterium MO_234.B1]|nr:rhodanese-like domain-containing protein [Xenococcaceae cyanobacterium MO_234.B1]
MFYSASIPEISVEELAQMLNERQTLQLIDVREPEEVEIAFIEGFEVLPLSQFQQWVGTIGVRFNSEVETVVLCHHGMRSAQMCQWLSNQGFTNVKNVAGGINAYSVRIDPSIPRY